MGRGQGQQHRRRPAHVGVVMRLVQPRSSKATYFLFAELCLVAVECWASQSVTWVQQLTMVSTWMGDPLRSGIPSGYVTSQLGHLSLAALQGRLIKYQLWLGLRHLCRVAGNTVWSCMWVPVAVWQVRLRTAMLYFMLYFSLLFTCFSVSAVCCCNCMVSVAHWAWLTVQLWTSWDVNWKTIPTYWQRRGSAFSLRWTQRSTDEELFPYVQCFIDGFIDLYHTKVHTIQNNVTTAKILLKLLIFIKVQEEEENIKRNCITQRVNTDLAQAHTHTHTGLRGWAGTRKVKPVWILLKQETVSGSGISWAICKSAPSSRQQCQHPPFSFFTGRMPFLPPNQQRQSTDGHTQYINVLKGTSNCIGTVYKYCNNEANKPVSRKIRETILHYSISGRLLPYLAANVDFNSDFWHNCNTDQYKAYKQLKEQGPSTIITSYFLNLRQSHH